MTVLKWELRKIWRPGILAAILLLGVVYYWMFPEFYIEYFSSGPAAQAQFQLASEWVAEYGPTLEPEERAELDSRLAEEAAAFKEQISAIPEAAAAGLTDYEAFCRFQEEYYSGTAASEGEADMDTEHLLNRVCGGTNWYIIQEIQETMERYGSLAESGSVQLANRKLDGQPEAMLRRAAQLAAPESRHSLLPQSVLHSTREYGRDLAVWCVLSIVLLLSPTLVRDRLRSTRSMQWTSRRGRAILRIQMAAALLSALVLTGVNLTVYALPFLAKGPLQFRACGLNGLWTWETSWFDWSYGTYLLVLAGLLLALSLSAAGLTVFLSQYSGSYIGMLLKALPLFVALGALLGSWLLDQPFTFRRFWENGPWVPRGTEAALAAALLAVSILLCALSCRRQKRRELL